MSEVGWIMCEKHKKVGMKMCDAALTRRIRERLRGAKCRLVERAAALALEECLADSRVARATVSVRKADCVPGLASAEVVFARRRTAT